MSADLHEVLSVAIKIINYIKSDALNSRLFRNLCQDMDSEYQSLLLHTEVWWLSKGRSLHRLVDLKEEVMIFLSGKNSPLEAFFHDQEWLRKICYLADIFEKLNDVNISMQGKNSNVLTLKDKVNGFLKNSSYGLI